MEKWGYKYTISVYCEAPFNYEKHCEVMDTFKPAVEAVGKQDYVEYVGIMVDEVENKPTDQGAS